MWDCTGNLATTEFLRSAKRLAAGMDASGSLRTYYER
jgi:hypothetical protein